MNNISVRFTLLILYFIIFPFYAVSQYTLNLRVKPTASHPIDSTSHSIDSIFIAGSFNEWNPGNAEYLLKKNDDFFTLSIVGLPNDIYQFKFTRGNWRTSEVDAKGKDIDNRLIKLGSDTTVECTIEGWKDDFTKEPKRHTTSVNIRILDTAFIIPQLNTTRRVWIYLPEKYAASRNKRRYPVIYMHDGQNVFDEFTAGYGEWGVDECLDSLVKNGKPESIIVGIDCGPNRMNEYNPYNSEKFGTGEGKKYVDFIVRTLKPFIDKHYRTKTSRENTIIAGSSMGGLISYYAMLTHPHIFGNAGIFSPAFWTAPEIKALTDSLAEKLTGKVFFYMGELEGRTYVADMKEITDKLGANSNAVIYTVIDPEARHNEQAWRKWFEEFYLWIIGDGFNNRVKTDR